VNKSSNRTNLILPACRKPVQRKNSVWSCGCEDDPIAFETEEEKKDWVAHLRDSAERLKIMAYYLSQQAKEIEESGYPKTTCYYPE
jgi:hypothetical protein